MSVKFNVKIDFDQRIISDEVIELLANNLKEDLDRDVLKISLRESLATVTKGTKLQNGPANDLLICILRALSLEEIDIGDETFQGGSLDDDNLEPTPAKSQDSGSKKKDEPVDPSKQGLDKYVCKFYANGKCRFSTECRSSHPKICPKYRQNGEITKDPKGCDGKCGDFHPNGCRQSLKTKTCTYKDCRFFHIKGTKTVERSQDRKSAPSQHSKKTVPKKDNKQHGSTNDNNKNKNNQKQKNAGKFESNNKFNVLNMDKPVTQQVFRQEKSKLDSTLDAIMRELADIRTWQKIRTETSQPNSQPLFRPQPPIPVVPQPTSQWTTQDQHMAWNSQNY